MTTLVLIKRIAIGATVLTVLGLAVGGIYWKEVGEFVRRNDVPFTLVGHAIGPFLALLGFFWGVVDKLEIKSISKELGAAEKAATTAQQVASTAKQELAQKVARIEGLENDLATIADSGRLWKLRTNEPFSEYQGWKDRQIGAKIVTVSLFKGGVGKTHLAANFAAYVSEKLQKRVLLIDLDYQGSLSASMHLAAGIDRSGSNVDALFADGADLATLSQKRIHLVPGTDCALNHGRGMPRTWLVPADYTLNQVESGLLIKRVMHEGQGIDERYRLAHVLLHPHVRREYDLIIIDTPPRMTLGTVNAFVASHNFIVPTILDRVSSEAVLPFLKQVKLLKNDLDLDLRLAGVVGTLTRQLGLSGNEPRYLETIEATARELFGEGYPTIVPQTMPRRAAVTTSDDLGYFLDDLDKEFYDAIFNELWKRIMSPQNQTI